MRWESAEHSEPEEHSTAQGVAQLYSRREVVEKKKKDISCVVLCRVVHETKCIGGGMAGYKLKHGRVSETNATEEGESFLKCV